MGQAKTDSHAIYSNCIGTFVFKETKKIDESFYTKEETYENALFLEKGQQINAETEMLRKYPGAELLGKNQAPPTWVLDHFSDEGYDEKMREATMLVTKRKIAESVRKDHLIIQAVNSIEETDRVANNLSKRLREWYELYNPEFSRSIESHEKFTELIQEKTKKELLKEAGASEEETMGTELEQEDLTPVMRFAKEITSLFKLREEQAGYVEKSMQEIMPNVTAIAGAMIGAKLLALAGSLQKMAMFPASTIQLLGAEKALFRHIKTGAKPPKFGVIINHPFITNAPYAQKGRAARMLADKISIASKIDFFKGEFRGDQLRKELEEKLQQGVKEKRK